MGSDNSRDAATTSAVGANNPRVFRGVNSLKRRKSPGRIVAMASFLVLIFALGLSAVTMPQPGNRIPVPERLVVLGVPGLTWGDVASSDFLRELTNLGATGSILPEDYPQRRCAQAVWANVGAGAEALVGCDQAVQVSPSNQALNAADVTNWQQLKHANMQAGSTAQLGLLGEQLPDQLSASDANSKGSIGQNPSACVAAIGSESVLAAATSSGKLTHYLRSVPSTAGNQASSALGDCALTIVSFPSSPTGPAAYFDAMANILTGIDPNSRVIIMGLPTPGSRNPRPVILLDPQVPPGNLLSSSTKNSGYLRDADIASLLFSAPLPGFTGAAWTVTADNAATPQAALTAGKSRRQAALNQERLYQYVEELRIPVMVLLGMLAVLSLAAALIPLPGTSLPAWQPALTLGAAAAVPALPIAMTLPWWNITSPTLAFTVFAGLWAIGAALIGAISHSGSKAWHGRLQKSTNQKNRGYPLPRYHYALLLLSGITVSIFALDVIAHIGWQQRTPGLTTLPVRFFGMGNVGFAIFATSLLIFAGISANHGKSIRQPRLAIAAQKDPQAAKTAAFSAGIIILTGSAIAALPFWGADVGSLPGLLIPGAVLTLLALDGNLSLRRLLLSIATAGFALLALLFGDWLRPESARTHAGRFAQSLLDGEAPLILLRRMKENFHMLLHPPTSMFSLLLLLAVIAFLLIKRGPAMRLRNFLQDQKFWPATAAIAWCWTVSFLLNDSGVAIPPAGGFIAFPLLGYALIAARRDNTRERQTT